MDVIVLNGASSSGKSSIASALQDLLPEYYLHVGIDTFIDMMPRKSNLLESSDLTADGFYFATINIQGNDIRRIKSGDYGKKVNRAYHSTVRHFVDSGLKVIVDDVMNGLTEQVEWKEVLRGRNVLFVGVQCSTEILIERESRRSDRMQGSALEQANRVHSEVSYDLVVSTTSNSALDCANEIIEHITITGC